MRNHNPKKCCEHFFIYLSIYLFICTLWLYDDQSANTSTSSDLENERDEEAARLVTLALTLETERASVREEMRVRKYCTDIRVYVYVCACVREVMCLYACMHVGIV